MYVCMSLYVGPPPRRAGSEGGGSRIRSRGGASPWGGGGLRMGPRPLGTDRAEPKGPAAAEEAVRNTARASVCTTLAREQARVCMGGRVSVCVCVRVCMFMDYL